jgi:GT2 family glycosyltransferase
VTELRVAFVEPHLRRFGGIRRMVELANRLIDRGHEVTFFLPPGEQLSCGWLPCAAPVRSLAEAEAHPLDVVLFNHEPQWLELARFDPAAAWVFYALHFGRLYGKPGSWASLHADTDLVLANSAWTADHVERVTGLRPPVLLGGIDETLFRPVATGKRYPILCIGDVREWKGTATIEAAARLLELPLERLAPKNLPQREMALEYARAEVFVVGSRFEGFGWPGLEALACAVPLVTTDNGGCGEYAVDGETALVVPPDDPEAMADAIARLRSDPALAARLVAAGLELVQSRFRWDDAIDEFEQHLRTAVSRRAARTTPRSRVLRQRPTEPRLSIVIPSWDGRKHLEDAVESIRWETDVPYELILIDNGSKPETASFVREAGDATVRNAENRGFASAMNQGLAAARGDAVAFCNDDIVVPPQWASRLLEQLDDATVGIVVPSVSAAQGLATVREGAEDRVDDILPFSAAPPAVVYVLRTDLARALGGWSEEYGLASGEDLDLAYTVWVNGLRIVHDARVHMRHVAKATASRLDWKPLWRRNRLRFMDRWSDLDRPVPRLPTVTPDDLAYRRAVAAATVGWMRAYFDLRETPLLRLLGAPPELARRARRARLYVSDSRLFSVSRAAAARLRNSKS